MSSHMSDQRAGGGTKQDVLEIIPMQLLLGGTHSGSAACIVYIHVT